MVQEISIPGMLGRTDRRKNKKRVQEESNELIKEAVQKEMQERRQEWREKEADKIIENIMMSNHAATVILSEVDNEGMISYPRLYAANPAAHSFYNRIYEENEESSLRNMIWKDLLDIIKEWMDPDDLAWFLKDQERVQEELKKGIPALATVPIKFNDTHPIFPDKEFYIVIANEMTRVDDKKTKKFMTILYIKFDFD